MATPKRYKYWNKDGSIDYDKMGDRRVRNPRGMTGARSVEYVQPGRTRVYYPDRTLVVSFTESPQKFRRKVINSMGGNVRPRENGNQIIVSKMVRDQIRSYDNSVKQMREDRIKEQVREREAIRKEREAMRKAQAKAKAKAKAKPKKSKSKRNVATMIPEGFVPASATRGRSGAVRQVRNTTPRTVVKPVKSTPRSVPLSEFGGARPREVPKSHIWEDIDLNQF